MHLTTLFTLALASLATASSVSSSSLPTVPPSKRQLSTVKSAVDTVTTALTALDTAVSGITPGGDVTAQTAAVTTASESLQTALTDGTTSVKSATPLSLVDALGLVAPTQNLATTAKTTITNLIGKKSIIDGARQTATVLEQLGGQRTATAAFGDAVVGKVPKAVGAIAQGIADQATEAIDAGIVAFGGTVPAMMSSL